MSFAEAVAGRANTDVTVVDAVLLEYGIELQPTGAAPVSLVVDRLRFTGVKHRDGRDDEPFEFEQEFGSGLWAITSETSNLAGKSSVLFVLRWALSGRSHLTDDVHDWIEAVELDGSVAGETFSVRFTNGGDGVAGELTITEGPELPFDSASFEEVMDGLFLDRLRLEAMPFWQARGSGENEGDRRRFGWNSYFPALHLQAENSGFLLGDQPQGGQPGTLTRILQQAS